MFTSMTGFQDNPDTGVTITKEKSTRVILEDLVRGCGVIPENIWVEDSFDLAKMAEKLKEAVKPRGVRVFISRHLCSLLEMSLLRTEQSAPSIVKIDSLKCKGSFVCINHFGCPALNFNKQDKKAVIDQEIWRRCKVYVNVCPYNAISEV